MHSIQQSPVYVTSRQLNRLFRSAFPDAAKCLQIAHDLRDGRLIVANASKRYGKRIDAFVTAATAAPVSAAANAV